MPDDIVFSTVSNVDFGIGEIILTTNRADHIAIGHRDIASMPMTLLKSAIEQTTHVMWGNTEGRIVYISQNVTRGKGRPMAVVVERVEAATGTTGKVITASWYDGPPTKFVIWDSNVGFFATLDESADILYVSRGPALDAYAVEDNEDRTIWYRYADLDNSHVGVTIFAASRKTLEALAAIASKFLNTSTEQMRGRLAAVIQR